MSGLPSLPWLLEVEECREESETEALRSERRGEGGRAGVLAWGGGGGLNFF